MVIKTIQLAQQRINGAIRIGFLPLNDCAPLIMAAELGLFAARGLRVSLHQELGWATMRDKILYGELEAAHALAAMPLGATLGLGSIRCECVTGLILNLNGNAITLSEDLWNRGVRNGPTLRAEITNRRNDRVLTFGVVHRLSTHQYLLRKWLSFHGINPDRDIRMVVLPPSQMVTNLSSGNIDGFCVGEPWNSVAIEEGAGWCVETSLEIDSDHPEKVLMVRRDFAEKRASEHLLLLAALLDACEFCDNPANSERVAETLARPEYVDAPAATLLAGLTGRFHCGHGITRDLPDFVVFSRRGGNEPSAARAAWLLELVRATTACNEPSALNHVLGRRVYRADIFESALQLRASQRNEKTDEKSSEPNLQAA